MILEKAEDWILLQSLECKLNCTGLMFLISGFIWNSRKKLIHDINKATLIEVSPMTSFFIVSEVVQEPFYLKLSFIFMVLWHSNKKGY